MSENDTKCCVCLCEPEHPNRIISPCLCSGSIKYCKMCVSRIILESGDLKCMICHTDYAVIVRKNNTSTTMKNFIMHVFFEYVGITLFSIGLYGSVKSIIPSCVYIIQSIFDISWMIGFICTTFLYDCVGVKLTNTAGLDICNREILDAAISELGRAAYELIECNTCNLPSLIMHLILIIGYIFGIMVMSKDAIKKTKKSILVYEVIDRSEKTS